jgi:hypothetical protein
LLAPARFLTLALHEKNAMLVRVHDDRVCASNRIWCLSLIIRFVIDAADRDKLDAARTELRNLLDKPQLASIPVLVLGNKNDLPGALTVEEIVEIM